MQVRLSPEALLDLQAIQSFIAMDNPRAAAAIGNGLLAACLSLQDFPQRGRRGRAPDTRELVSGRYVVSYRIASDHVRVVRIQHSRQQR